MSVSSLIPQSGGVRQWGPGACGTSSGFVSQVNNSELRKCQPYKGTPRKPTSSCYPGQEIDMPFVLREMPSLSPKDAIRHVETPWKSVCIRLYLVPVGHANSVTPLHLTESDCLGTVSHATRCFLEQHYVHVPLLLIGCSVQLCRQPRE